MDAVSAADFDVNMTGLVDINDAQLVYDMYNGKYDNFTTINMHRFLNADVNADKKITVTDAAAVVSVIK
jgi:HKD family nuclease